MIETIKSYPEYKDSAIPWLGGVPKHWEVVRAKWLFRYRKHLNTDGGERNVLSLTLRGVVNNDPNDPEGLVPKDYASYQVFEKNDLVFKLIDLENLRTSRVGIVHERGVMSPAYVRLTHTAGGSTRFFYHQFYDLYSRGVYNQLGAGVRSTLGPSDLLNLPVLVPPPVEQGAIINFLNYANWQIERAIRAKKKLIALLNEQKQAIIHLAVTCGLDPTVPLKPSGIPWLGDIPKHWEVLPVKRCSCVISKGTTPSTEGREILEAGPVRFLKAENISGGMIVDKPLAFIDEETHRMLRRSQLLQDDILFVIAGATLGKTAIVQPEHLPANTNQAVAFIRPNRRVVPEFLALWLQSPRITEQIWLNAVQSAQPNLSMASLGMFFVPILSREEQAAIVQGIKSDTSLFVTAISRLEREIALLGEYRTRLTADVVTGQLDVTRVSVPAMAKPEPEKGAEIDDCNAMEGELTEEITVENNAN